jgi:flotillin
MGEFIGSSLAVLVLMSIVFVVWLLSRYKRCPSNKVLVVYGKVGKGRSANCIHGGGAFILPVIQDWKYLSLSPIPIEIDLRGALSKQNIRINTPSTFTVGISTREEIMLNAAERLLGLDEAHIKDQALDIIIGQLRLVIATLTIEEINQDREQFLQLINKHVASELNKVGLELINVNIKDITDESGYIEAIGKKAAAEAVNKAKVEVAQQESSGAMGEAAADRERQIRVTQERAQSEEGQMIAEKTKRVNIAKLETEALTGEAESNRLKEIRVSEEQAQAEEGRKAAESAKRIRVAELEAQAVEGENLSKAKVAIVDADLQEKEAEARKRSNVAYAQSRTSILEAEAKAELARLEKEEIVHKEIEKRKIEIDAEAHAEETRRIARGDADAVRMKFEAEAEGMQKLLEAKAEGYRQIIASCNNDVQSASTMLLIEKMETLIAKQTEAIANLKIDKITVWDSGSGDGKSSTANFLRGFSSMLPPLHELAQQTGIDLPNFLGGINPDAKENHIGDKAKVEIPVKKTEAKVEEYDLKNPVK